MPRVPSPSSLCLDCSCKRTTGSKKWHRAVRRTPQSVRLLAPLRCAGQKNHRKEFGLEAASHARRSRIIPTIFYHPAGCDSTIHEYSRKTLHSAFCIRHRAIAHISQKASRWPRGCTGRASESGVSDCLATRRSCELLEIRGRARRVVKDKGSGLIKPIETHRKRTDQCKELEGF